ncbi:MAG: CPBP family glutamic-type intramembrane protease, partial [Candidatus Omnitrophica bacterium]|nr:CPBP family glutamic-type intramembrane protease [Candidatus Omnitrophota bacterium]
MPSCSIPSKFASVEESAQGPSGKLIIYIQDAHDSLDAQQNIAAIIGHLTETAGVKTVFEEGYEGPVPTDRYFGFMKDAHVRRCVSRFLMDKLRVSGAEFAHINRRKDFKLIGADDLGLHMKNIEWYRKTAKQKDAAEQDLDYLLSEINRMAQSRFSEQLKTFPKLKAQFEAQQLNPPEYVRRLAGLGGENDFLEKSGRYPVLASLLQALAGKNGKFPETAGGIDARAVWREILDLEKETAGRFLTTDRDRQIYGYYRSVTLLKRLIAVEIGAAEYAGIKPELRHLNTAAIAALIADATKHSVVLSRAWEKALADAVRFYDTAEERELAIEKALQVFKENPEEKIAVLIFGGFHKDPIKRILQTQGFAYQIVSPKIGTVSERHQAYYRKLMTLGYDSVEVPLNVSRASRAPGSLGIVRQNIAQELPWEAQLQRIDAITAGLLRKGREATPEEIDLAMRSEMRTKQPIADSVKRSAPTHDLAANRSSLNAHFYRSETRQVQDELEKEILKALRERDPEILSFVDSTIVPKDAGSGAKGIPVVFAGSNRHSRGYILRNIGPLVYLDREFQDRVASPKIWRKFIPIWLDDVRPQFRPISPTNLTIASLVEIRDQIQGKVFVDFGAGTYGLVGLAAGKLGAAKIIFVEHKLDKHAGIRKLAKRNGLVYEVVGSLDRVDPGDLKHCVVAQDIGYDFGPEALYEILRKTQPDVVISAGGYLGESRDAIAMLPKSGWEHRTIVANPEKHNVDQSDVGKFAAVISTRKERFPRSEVRTSAHPLPVLSERLPVAVRIDRRVRPGTRGIDIPIPGAAAFVAGGFDIFNSAVRAHAVSAEGVPVLRATHLPSTLGELLEAGNRFLFGDTVRDYFRRVSELPGLDLASADVIRALPDMIAAVGGDTLLESFGDSFRYGMRDWRRKTFKTIRKMLTKIWTDLNLQLERESLIAGVAERIAIRDILAAPLLEEVLFRYYLPMFVKLKWGEPFHTALRISHDLFALCHWVYTESQVNYDIPYQKAVSYGRLTAQSLMASIGFHALNNFIFEKNEEREVWKYSPLFRFAMYAGLDLVPVLSSQTENGFRLERNSEDQQVARSEMRLDTGPKSAETPDMRDYVFWSQGIGAFAEAALNETIDFFAGFGNNRQALTAAIREWAGVEESVRFRVLAESQFLSFFYLSQGHLFRVTATDEEARALLTWGRYRYAGTDTHSHSGMGNELSDVSGLWYANLREGHRPLILVFSVDYFNKLARYGHASISLSGDYHERYFSLASGMTVELRDIQSIIMDRGQFQAMEPVLLPEARSKIIPYDFPAQSDDFLPYMLSERLRRDVAVPHGIIEARTQETRKLPAEAYYGETIEERREIPREVLVLMRPEMKKIREVLLAKKEQILKWTRSEVQVKQRIAVSGERLEQTEKLDTTRSALTANFSRSETRRTPEHQNARTPGTGARVPGAPVPVFSFGRAETRTLASYIALADRLYPFGETWRTLIDRREHGESGLAVNDVFWETALGKDAELSVLKDSEPHWLTGNLVTYRASPDQPAHGYLIVGDVGSGKTMLAYYLAAESGGKVEFMVEDTVATYFGPSQNVAEDKFLIAGLPFMIEPFAMLTSYPVREGLPYEEPEENYRGYYRVEDFRETRGFVRLDGIIWLTNNAGRFENFLSLKKSTWPAGDSETDHWSDDLTTRLEGLPVLKVAIPELEAAAAAARSNQRAPMEQMTRDLFGWMENDAMRTPVRQYSLANPLERAEIPVCIVTSRRQREDFVWAKPRFDMTRADAIFNPAQLEQLTALPAELRDSVTGIEIEDDVIVDKWGDRKGDLTIRLYFASHTPVGIYSRDWDEDTYWSPTLAPEFRVPLKVEDIKRTTIVFKPILETRSEKRTKQRIADSVKRLGKTEKLTAKRYSLDTQFARSEVRRDKPEGKSKKKNRKWPSQDGDVESVRRDEVGQEEEPDDDVVPDERVLSPHPWQERKAVAKTPRKILEEGQFADTPAVMQYLRKFIYDDANAMSEIYLVDANGSTLILHVASHSGRLLDLLDQARTRLRTAGIPPYLWNITPDEIKGTRLTIISQKRPAPATMLTEKPAPVVPAEDATEIALSLAVAAGLAELSSGRPDGIATVTVAASTVTGDEEIVNWDTLHQDTGIAVERLKDPALRHALSEKDWKIIVCAFPPDTPERSSIKERLQQLSVAGVVMQSERRLIGLTYHAIQRLKAARPGLELIAEKIGVPVDAITPELWERLPVNQRLMLELRFGVNRHRARKRKGFAQMLFELGVAYRGRPYSRGRLGQLLLRARENLKNLIEGRELAEQGFGRSPYRPKVMSEIPENVGVTIAELRQMVAEIREKRKPANARMRLLREIWFGLRPLERKYLSVHFGLGERPARSLNQIRRRIARDRSVWKAKSKPGNASLMRFRRFAFDAFRRGITGRARLSEDSGIALRHLNALLKTLDDEQRKVIRLDYGIDTLRLDTNEEIAAQTGIAKTQRIRDVKRGALQKMRRHAVKRGWAAADVLSIRRKDMSRRKTHKETKWTEAAMRAVIDGSSDEELSTAAMQRRKLGGVLNRATAVYGSWPAALRHFGRDPEKIQIKGKVRSEMRHDKWIGLVGDEDNDVYLQKAALLIQRNSSWPAVNEKITGLYIAGGADIANALKLFPHTDRFIFVDEAQFDKGDAGADKVAEYLAKKSMTRGLAGTT